jgi:hypothetical protein
MGEVSMSNLREALEQLVFALRDYWDDDGEADGKSETWMALRNAFDAARAALAAAEPLNESWKYCPVCGVALERLTPQNRGMMPLPDILPLVQHVTGTKLCDDARK